ncbi:MAG: site-specific DNA-methyltransferase [Candidatus Aenigmatarchaeota archaeon]
MRQDYEQKFYNLLTNMFVGAEVEGTGGYINLMKIKKKYYDEVFKPKLEQKIKEILNQYPNFKEELFEKIYTFFSRYFSESGSIYFVNTPYYHQIYDRVYTDKEDIILFWKTRDLYYLKTDRIYKSLEVVLQENNKEFRFYFDVSTLEVKKANEKRELIYELDESQTSEERFVFKVYYSEKGKTTKIDEILKKLKNKFKNKNIKLTEEILEKAFKKFEQQSEIDYFIHKNAKAFLTEQLKLFIYNKFFSTNQDYTPERIDQINKLRECAEFIIDFVSKFEDELVKIWNKPRFVLNSNYVITLDRIIKQNQEKGIQIIEKIINHKNFSEQIREWKELNIIDEDFDKNKIIQKDLSGKNLNKKYQFLPIDTKYFKDLELEILSLFDNLDENLDGWLIKSENYQALNTILPKFKEKVQTIYIDPPFNKEQEADYFYSVKYKDSTWATMLENRLRLARELLKDTGSIFVRCDYNGNWIVRPLMDEIFGKENFRNEIIIKRTEGKSRMEGLSFSIATENLLFYAKSEKQLFNIPLRKTDFYKNMEILKEMIKKYKKLNQQLNETLKEIFWIDLDHRPGERTTSSVIDVFGIKFKAPNGRHWLYNQKRIDEAISQGKIRITCKICETPFYSYIDRCNKCGNEEFKVQIFYDEESLTTNWTDEQSYSQSNFWGIKFPTENSEILLKRVIESTSNEGDLVMDFFLGSGTTTAVAHKLKRKWIGIEMGEHFYTVVLPRMKKVLAYDKSGISKEKDVKEKYNENNAGGLFKYFELEQFPDILDKAKYLTEKESPKLFKEDFNYIFMADPKMLETLEIDYENNKIKIDFSKIYLNVDIAETFSCLKGKWIKKILENEIEFEDGEKVNLNQLEKHLPEIKKLIWW